MPPAPQTSQYGSYTAQQPFTGNAPHMYGSPQEARPYQKKKTSTAVIVTTIIACFILLGVGLYFILRPASDGDAGDNNVQINDAPAEATSPPEVTSPEETTPPETANQMGFTWIVEPTFDYDFIFFESWTTSGGFFAITGGETEAYGQWKLDSNTGQISGEYIGGTGGIPIAPFGYDSQEQVWVDLGEYSSIEYAGTFQEIAARSCVDIFTVEQVTIMDMAEIWGMDEEYGQAGYVGLGKFALANRAGLLTDFIFDDIDKNQTTTSFAVKRGDRWGFISNSGQQVIDFIFEDAVSIDDNRAFVKYDGRWGIIQKGT